MSDNFSIKKRMDIGPDRIEALFHIPVDSPWFSGHFSSNPILPAIALLGFIDQALQEAGAAMNKHLSIIQLKRTRFRQIVRPGEDVSVTVSPDKEAMKGKYRFKITKQNELVSDGIALTVNPSFEIPAIDVLHEGRTIRKTSLKVEELIPHQDRMKLLEQILGHDQGEYGIVSAVPKDTWPLCNGTDISPLVAIELVAQTTAVLVALDSSEESVSNRLGYIVGIKAARLSREPVQVGTMLTIQTEKHLWHDNYGVFQGVVKHESVNWGEVRLQVLRAE